MSIPKTLTGTATVGALLLVVFLFGRCSGTDRAAQEQEVDARTDIAVLADSIKALEPKLQQLTESLKTIDDRYRQREEDRGEADENAREAARQAAAWFDSLSADLPAPAVQAHTAQVHALNQRISIERERVVELNIRVSAGDRLIAGLENRVQLLHSTIDAKDVLISSLEKQSGGNFSLLGWRINARCGLGVAMGMSVRGNVDAVAGLACSVSP